MADTEPETNTPATRWTRRPAGSNWGDFGPDDVLGSMNFVTPQKVMEGIAEVRKGLTFNLCLPLDYPGGQVLSEGRFPPRLFATQRGNPPDQFYCRRLSMDDDGFSDVICDDAVLLSLQYSSQWDGLAHAGGMFDVHGDGRREMVFYNGYKGGEHVHPGQATDHSLPALRHEGCCAGPLGIDSLAAHGVQGRAVLVDLEKHFGRARRAIGYADLMAIMAADGVTVERGDMLCLYTGFADCIVEMNRSPDVAALNGLCTGLDGSDGRLLAWLSETGIACIIADNVAVELFPTNTAGAGTSGSHAMLPLHEHCLFKNGIFLGELWYLRELALWLRASRRSRFLLTAPPLRLPGAIASPPAPIATV